MVYRLGFADSRRQARQVVLHGHVTLNGRVTNVPSCRVREGDAIAWEEGSTKTVLYQEAAQEIESKVIPSWLSLDPGNMTGKVLSLPSREEIEAAVNERLIVAFYSR